MWFVCLEMRNFFLPFEYFCYHSRTVLTAVLGHIVSLPACGTDRQTRRQEDRQTRRQADKQTGRQADRQTGRHVDRQTGRPGDRQTGRRADRQTSSSPADRSMCVWPCVLFILPWMFAACPSSLTLLLFT